MKHTVFVDGQEGTTGLRIHEYLAGRDDIEVLRIAPERRKDAAERARLLNAADVAFLCLPDAAAKEAAALVTNPTTCLIDASTAHRTAPGWAFGLPELTAEQREQLRRAKRIANPGCHASAFILLMRPLVDAEIVPPALATSATSLTGYSGGGKKMIEGTRTPSQATGYPINKMAAQIGTRFTLESCGNPARVSIPNDRTNKGLSDIHDFDFTLGKRSEELLAVPLGPDAGVEHDDDALVGR